MHGLRRGDVPVHGRRRGEWLLVLSVGCWLDRGLHRLLPVPQSQPVAAPFFNPSSSGCSNSSTAWPGQYCCNSTSCQLSFCQSSAPRNRTFVFTNRCAATIYVGTQGFNLLNSNG